MNLVAVRNLKEDTFYKKIISELKIKGIDKLYIKKSESVDYFDIIISVITFVESNKNIIKKIKSEQLENIILILIDEVLEESNIKLSDDQIDKILQLLKNSLLIKKTTTFIYKNLVSLINKIKLKCKCTNPDYI